MDRYCVETTNGDLPTDETHVEMASVEQARSDVLIYLMSVAREEFVVGRERQEMQCVLKGANGEAILRANLMLKVETF